jgi:hypothetical protein
LGGKIISINWTKRRAENSSGSLFFSFSFSESEEFGTIGAAIQSF